jgi:hypothetical protein
VITLCAFIFSNPISWQLVPPVGRIVVEGACLIVSGVEAVIWELVLVERMVLNLEAVEVGLLEENIELESKLDEVWKGVDMDEYSISVHPPASTSPPTSERPPPTDAIVVVCVTVKVGTHRSPPASIGVGRLFGPKAIAGWHLGGGTFKKPRSAIEQDW